MTWTKLGDDFPTESRALTDGAFRTHVEALIWSSSRLLDLLIPKADLRRFCDCNADPEDAVSELVATGWWEDRGSHWYVGLRWPEWQLTRDQVETRREQTNERKRSQRARACQAGKHSIDCPAESCPAKLARKSRKSSSHLVASPNPTRPVPSHVPRDGTQDVTRDADVWDCDCDRPRIVGDDDGRTWCMSCGQAAP